MGDPMSERRCAMAPMVEAERDGRLDARDQASLARHLATCSACRSLQRDLDQLRELAARPLLPPATPLEHQRGRVALLNASVAPPTPPAASSILPAGRLAAGLAVAAALAATAGVWAHMRAPAPAVAMARTLPRLPRLAIDESAIESVTGARFDRTRTGGVERVQLDEGAIDLRVRPLTQGERFLVATADAEVEVRGTAFHVEAHHRHIAAVSVAEGTVEVRYAGALVVLHAGQSWTPPGAWSDATPAPSAAPAPGESPTTDPAAAPRVAAAAPPHPRPAGAPRDAAATAPGSGDPPAKAFVEGMAAIARGDYAAGAEKLDAYRAAHPGDARAADAAYMTVLALQRAGRREAAAAAARRYLAAYPNGDRRAEMRAIAGGTAARE